MATGHAALGTQPRAPGATAASRATFMAAQRWVLGSSLLLEQAPASAHTEHGRGLVFVCVKFWDLQSSHII